MSAILFKRSNTAGNDGYTGSLGEITVDTQLRKLRVHDGVLAGGYPVANMQDIQDAIDQIDNLTIEQIVGLEDALAAITDDIAALTTDKADKATTFTAGNGLTGGGDLSANRTVTLGTPSTVTGSTTNSTTSTSHTHALTVTKADVGLSNVDNTSDANKPVSTATQTALNLKINATEKGASNGVATLDGSGKVPLSQLSDSVLGQVEYMGTWNATTNVPTLPATPTEKGHYYVVSTAGTFQTITYAVGDWIISNGTAWEKVDNTDQVTSVAGKTGAVSLVKADVGLSNVDNTSDANKPVSTATQTALNLKVDVVAGKGLSTEDYTTAEKSKLAGIEAGAEVNEATDLSVSRNTTTVTVASSTGTDAALPAATTSLAGVMTSADKTKLDGIATGAQVNTVTSVAGKTGAVTLAKGDVALGNVQNYGVASSPEAIAGTVTDKYTTPESVRDFVENGDYTIDLGTF